MAATTKIFTNIPDNLEASDINGFTLENNNLIISSGIDANSNNNFQTTQSVANYVVQSGQFNSESLDNNYQLIALNNASLVDKYSEGMHFYFEADQSNTGIGGSQIAFPNLEFIQLVNPVGSSIQPNQIVVNNLYECIINDFSGDLKCIILNETFQNLPYASISSTQPIIANRQPLTTILPLDEILFNEGFVINNNTITLIKSGIYSIKVLLNTTFLVSNQEDSPLKIQLNFVLNGNDILSSKIYEVTQSVGSGVGAVRTFNVSNTFSLNASDSITLELDLITGSGQADRIIINSPGFPSNIFIKLERIFGASTEHVWVDELEEIWINEFDEPWTDI